MAENTINTVDIKPNHFHEITSNKNSSYTLNYRFTSVTSYKHQVNNIFSAIKLQKRGFTLIEVTMSIFLLMALIFMSNRVIESAEDYKSSTHETSIIDSRLNKIRNTIIADLSEIVLLEKNQPILEVVGKQNERGYCIYFFTTNSEDHVTIAVEYDISIDEAGKIKFRRNKLSPSNTLNMQTKIDGDTTLQKYFRHEKCESETCDLYLLSFAIRPAIMTHTKTENVIFPLTKLESDAYYMDGSMYSKYKNGYQKIDGDIIFFDMTIGALTKSDMMELKRITKNSPEKEAKFINERSRKAFAKIVPISTNF